MDARLRGYDGERCGHDEARPAATLEGLVIEWLAVLVERVVELRGAIGGVEDRAFVEPAQCVGPFVDSQLEREFNQGAALCKGCRGSAVATPARVRLPLRLGGEGRGEVGRAGLALASGPHLPRPLRPEGRRGDDARDLIVTRRRDSVVTHCVRNFARRFAAIYTRSRPNSWRCTHMRTPPAADAHSSHPRHRPMYTPAGALTGC